MSRRSTTAIRPSPGGATSSRRGGATLKQEAPWAYKDVGPVVDSLRTAGVAEPVVELRPILTVKG